MEIKGRYIAPSIALIAGLITSIISIMNGCEQIVFLERLLIAIIIFYIIGSIARVLIIKVTNLNTGNEEPPKEEDEEKEQNNINS